MRGSEDYEDIIGLPHHQSKTHKQMSVHDRAAQFSPFAALKGYDEEIEEAARYTEERRELDESRTDEINALLTALQDRAGVPLTVTCFRQDGKKGGGEYVTVKGRLKRIDGYAKKLILEEESVDFRDVVDIVVEECGGE